MTNNIRLSIESGRDGGLSVHEYDENNEPIHVFSGDVKQAGEYLLTRCTKLASRPVEAVAPVAKVVPARPLTPRVLADHIIDENVA